MAENSQDKENTSTFLPKSSNCSIWSADSSKSTTLNLLPQDVRADVCIVGAGVAGLTVAYFLAREGKSVVVIDKKFVGEGETINSSAHLSNAIDAGYRELEHYHGERGAKLAAESHTAAITAIESIAQNEGIDCDFKRIDGYLFLGADDSFEVLEDEFTAARRAGVDVEKNEELPSGIANGPYVKFPNQAQFHPGKYVTGLARAFERAGGQIYTGTEVIEVIGGQTAIIKTISGNTLSAEAVVIACNTPFNDRVTMHTKQAAYRTYVIGIVVPTGKIPEGLYWDTEDPFHYVRLARATNGDDTHEVLIIGGEDHKTGQTEEVENRFDRLLSWGRTHFGDLSEPEFRWSGQIMDSADGLAFIGRNPGDEPNVFIVTGDSGVGLTHGTIAGILITDLVMGRENAWATLYDPSRKMIRASLEFARENANAIGQYRSWVTPGDIGNVNEITPGTGAIVREGLSKIAVYRDESGALHRRSAVCPHLGCIVVWNKTERSWDCPCHGSRFGPLGEILNGPALSPLKPN